MEEGQQNFKHIVEKSTVGKVVIDLEGIVKYANPAALTILNLSEKKLIGTEFPYPVSANKTTELRISHESGDYRVAEMRVTEIEWNNKPAYLVLLHDITDLERIERLKAEIMERQRVDQLKDEFISTVSHELRTPLTIVKGAIDNLKDGIVGPLEARQERIVAIANNNVERLVKIINNLLDLSRLESNKAHINRKAIKTSPLIVETAHNFQIAAQSKNIVLEQDVPENLPDIFADPDLIVQLLTNILDNALRYAQTRVMVSASRKQLQTSLYSDEGGAEEKKETPRKAEEVHKFVQITVSDDGPGIPKDKCRDLFNKFVQLNRPRGGAGYKGTGLGLAICKEIVHKHQGKIWVEQGSLGGAGFHILLPQFDETVGFWRLLRALLVEGRKKKKKVCLLSFTVKNFRKLADQRSSAEMESMLKIIESRIKEQIFRKSDLTFCYTPKDFIVVLPDTDREQADKVLKRIEEEVEISFGPVPAGTLLPELGIGLAIFPDDAQEPEALLNIVLNMAEQDRSMV